MPIEPTQNLTARALASLSNEALIEVAFLAAPADPLTLELFKRFDALVNPDNSPD